jgi:hypothetical protein
MWEVGSDAYCLTWLGNARKKRWDEKIGYSFV